MKVKTEKLHILYVLRDGASRNAYAIQQALAKDFRLKPRLNTLRKNLQRCFRQNLVDREKSGANYSYWITDRGKKRLLRVIAKRIEELHEVPEEPKVLDARRKEKLKQRWMTGRVFEVVSSLRLCDALLGCTVDNKIRSVAAAIRMYWQLKYAELVPHVAERFGKTVEQLYEQTSRNMERLFR
jgi:DNA-binding PadR family transcriptional regulator